jgi:hypothetical protein
MGNLLQQLLRAIELLHYTSQAASSESVGTGDGPTVRIYYMKNQINRCEISGSHGGEYEDGCLVGCCAM